MNVTGFDLLKVRKKILCLCPKKDTQYKDKWAVEVFRTWQAAREQKFCILDPGSVFKDDVFHRVQSLEEKLEDLDSLSQNFWVAEFVQKVLIRTVVPPK